MDNFRDSYFNVTWDLTKKHLRGTFWGKQYDTGRGFAVTVINGGQVVTPTTEVLRLKWEKPDNTTGYVNATIVNGKFVIENIDQMFTVAGSVRADLELSVGGEFVASITFYVSVEKAVAVDAIESSSQFTALQEALADVGDMQAQVDAVIANATVDSEVILARGAEPTLGDRLDGTDAQLAETAQRIDNIVTTPITEGRTTFLIHDETSNLIDKTTLLKDTYINGAVDGKEKSFVQTKTLYATDFIPIEPDTPYYQKYLYLGYFAFYDANKNYISGAGIQNETPLLTSPFTTPANAYYIRVTIINDANVPLSWINKTNKKPADIRYKFDDNIFISSRNIMLPPEGEVVPTEYGGDDIAIFNNILAIGDSLTAGTFNIRGGDIAYVSYEHYAFPKYLQKMTGVTVNNVGRGGKTTKEWYDLNVNTPLTGYDCAIIQLGVNDLIRGSTLDETKTYLTNIINKLKTENKGIKIFVSTIIPATSYSNEGYIAISEAIREVVTSIASDVYLVDLAAYGHTKDEEAYNNGHLSAYGYWKLAKDYKSYISYIIANNKLAFRNVQFAGTDYTY